MNAKKRREIYETLKSIYPYPSIELKHSTPFELLIAVILSSQTTDTSVNNVLRNIFPIANTPSQFIFLGEKKFAEQIKSIGLYRTKAKNIIATCQLLLNRYSGEVPETRDALESLPGVGRKTANILLNSIFGYPTIAVDTHVFRIANRTGMAPGKNVRSVEAALEKFTPKEFKKNAHDWLILQSRHTCKAKYPECWHCTIKLLCEFKLKTSEKTYKNTL
ncbi:MAG: endonuclease III [Burkholderia sp.]|nr:endonuclease III [Burkholderia sp.]